jgi:hypothetical protein
MIYTWTPRVYFLEYIELDRSDANGIVCQARVELNDGGSLNEGKVFTCEEVSGDLFD